MEKDIILEELKPVFRNTLENDSININYDTTASHIEEWDSMHHIQLVVAIEKRFKIRFTSKEILNWQNVGDIVNSIQSKANKRL